jgi:hypothetical protein
MPDLDLIKQGEQGWDRRGRFAWAGRAIPPAGRAAGGRHPCPAIETNDFERHLQLVEADRSDDPAAVIGMYGAEPGRRLNP